MAELTIHIEAQINPTETEQKVRQAVENIFGPLNTQLKPLQKGTLLQASTTGPNALIKFHNLLHREHIRTAARAVLVGGLHKNGIDFCLNKQVAFAGHISFSKEENESPLGPIRVQIRTEDPRQTIQYLTATARS
jgi:predicted RNA binding protein with dsRBD fold (UPF0201 family)